MYNQNDVKRIATLTSEIRDHNDQIANSVALAESLVLKGWLKIPPNRVDYLLSLMADVRSQIERDATASTDAPQSEKSEILLLCHAIEKALA